MDKLSTTHPKELKNMRFRKYQTPKCTSFAIGGSFKTGNTVIRACTRKHTLGRNRTNVYKHKNKTTTSTKCVNGSLYCFYLKCARMGDFRAQTRAREKSGCPCRSRPCKSSNWRKKEKWLINEEWFYLLSLSIPIITQWLANVNTPKTPNAIKLFSVVSVRSALFLTALFLSARWSAW